MISDPKPLALTDATPSLLLRIVTKVVVNRTTGCWEWTGAFSAKRRGQRPVIQLGGRGTRVVLVSRVMLWLTVGAPLRDYDEGCHTCPHGENQKCINPDHLVWGSRLENERMKRREGERRSA